MLMYSMKGYVRQLLFFTNNRIRESMGHGVNPTIMILTQQSAVLCMGLAIASSGD